MRRAVRRHLPRLRQLAVRPSASYTHHTPPKTHTAHSPLQQQPHTSTAASNPNHTTKPNKTSFYQRPLPPNLARFDAPENRQRFIQAVANGTAEAYFPLAQQFTTQTEPAFCGPSCLAMILNTLRIDPNTIWKGGWRWFDERTIVSSCCKPLDVIETEGITLDEFASLGRCHGAAVELCRPVDGSSTADDEPGTEAHFRSTLISSCSSKEAPFMIVSFLRTALGQTGTGHFSPVAAYHRETDSALILDIARFKLPPYWAPVSTLYEAMRPLDPATGLPRGYALLGGDAQEAGTKRTMAQLGGGGGVCPVTEVKKTYCPVSPMSRRRQVQ